MSIAPHTGIVDFGTFTAPTASTDGIQGEVPQPLAGQEGYVLTGTGWASAGSVGLVGYQGTWNASTNTPTLTSSVGVQGYYYVVDVAGTTNLNGITDWQVGDWAIFNGSIWQKVDNTDSYDPANVAITGGTINNTVIGGTTPAAGTFTTLTAQTEVLKGTGQNLVLQSENFTVTWATSGSAGTGATANAATSPTGTSNASKIFELSATGVHGRSQAVSLGRIIPVTYSMYAKASERTKVRVDMSDLLTGDIYQDFDLSTGSKIGSVVSSGSWANTSSAIISVGSGWYRCSITGIGGNTAVAPVVQLLDASGAVSYVGNGTSGIFAWGAQLEISSSAGTYTATTTTAVYGTPTLSFSGVSTIGLESNGSLFVQPAGTGALQAQATTSSTVGGNARGANAVDWQTTRDTAARVASATASTISGGYGNQATGAYSVVVGGYNGTTSGFGASVLGGAFNTTSNSYTTVAGYQNTVSSPYSSILGGQANTAAGYYNFIGAGFTNAGTSASAVTTQSGTMNGTTAVTLSGSNANIKVGQYITGTSIAGDTYVSNIVGTALTLSKNASGSSTSTLSFYTPHGVVVGGGNNIASGLHSFIGGGGYGGTTSGGTGSNRATGDWSTVVGGSGNLASGSNSFIGGGGYQIGNGNTASGFGASIVGGYQNTASGFTTAIVGGNGNTATGNYSVAGGNNNQSNGANSVIAGGQYGTARGLIGYYVFPACQFPIAAVNGVSQGAMVILGKETTNATATVLTSDGAAASGVNQVILPNNSAYYFKGSVIANVTGAANGASWSFEGAIMRGANAASTVLIGTPAINRVAATAGATAWVIALTADTTNGGLAVTVTGAASTTIRWVASVNTVEVTF